MRKSLILLGILDDSDVEWILREGVKRRLPTGAVLVAEGVQLESLHVLLSGSLGVALGSGARIARLLAGDIVGEMSFVDARPPSATVLADEESWVVEIPRLGVRDRLAEDSAFAARFYRAIAVFLSLRMRETAARMGFGQARAAGEEEGDDEIPEDILDKLAIAAHRFSILQERARVAGD